MRNADFRVFAGPGAPLVAGHVLLAPGWRQPLQQPDASQTDRMIAELGLREAATPLSASPQWRKPARVLVRNLTPERKAWLQDVAPGVELLNADTMSEARTVAATADAVLGFCEEAVLAASPDVRWVQTYNAGVERCLTSDVFRQRGIVLTNMQRIAGPVMAEHVMALVLAHARGLAGYVMAQREGRWARGVSAANWTPFNALSDGDQPAFTLAGKTILIVGYGGVGSEVAKRAQAFGMRIIAIRNSKADLPPGVTRMGLPADLPDVRQGGRHRRGHAATDGRDARHVRRGDLRGDEAHGLFRQRRAWRHRRDRGPDEGVAGSAPSAEQDSMWSIPSRCPRDIRSGRRRDSS